MHETTRLLRDLVTLPSVNPMGRPLQGPEIFENRITDYLENYFRGLGAPYERQLVAPQRENIAARCDLPGARRTLLLEVHQDTVPTDNMTIDPFGAVITDGKLYGRGACDVKGGMAAMLVAFARVFREKPRNAANLILACTVDEEHTFLGVQRLVRDGLRAHAAVVAEPTSLQIVHTHKGLVRWHLHTPGRACHSSSPEQGINAIYRMGKLLGAIEHYAENLRASRSDPYLGPPTLSVGRIDGGASVNTVPDRCRIEVDRRLLPGEEGRPALHDFVAFLEKEKGDVPFECSEPWFTLPPLHWDGTPGKKEFVDQFGSVLDAVLGLHRVIAVPYGTDASTIAESGIPAIVFGPGDIAQAHTCDEWISIEEVEQASDILFRLICVA
jgi:acetylornithine deacetylase